MTPSALLEPLQLPLSQEDLDAINAHLKFLTPEEILQWAVERIPDLYQTTAFGLTGLVAIDMLSKITKSPPPPIFLDTLYHFPETYELVDVVKAHYDIPVIVYKPEGCATREAFELKYGERFWERDERGYDIAVKVGKEMVHINDELTLVYYLIGRTRQAGLLRIGCKGCDHWPPSLPGGSPFLPRATRTRRDGAVEAQPALRVDIRVRRLVHQGKQRPAQQTVGSGLSECGGLAQHDEERGGRRRGACGTMGRAGGKDGVWIARGLLQDKVTLSRPPHRHLDPLMP
jgi:hypothetical protein